MPQRPKKPKQPPAAGSAQAPTRRKGTRHLPKHFESLATGEETRARPPRPPNRRLHDDRQRVVIPGVNNRDARLVLDARLAELGETQADDLRAKRLFEAFQLAIWRARSITGFDAFAEDVVGLPREEARALAESGAQAAGQTLETLPERQVAMWLRTEAAVREHTPSGSARIADHAGRAMLELLVPVEPAQAAVTALAGVGRQAAGLGRHLERPGRDPGEPGSREQPAPRQDDRGSSPATRRAPDRERAHPRTDRQRGRAEPDPRSQHGRGAPTHRRRRPPGSRRG